MIRPLVAADQAAWRTLWTAYLEFYESTVEEDVYATTFARLLDPDRRQYAQIAFDTAGDAIGLVHYFPHPHNWKIGDVMYLQDLYVSDKARGTGAGRALIEAVYAHSDELGCADVYWTTQHFNETARKLYDRIGQLTPFVKYQR